MESDLDRFVAIVSALIAGAMALTDIERQASVPATSAVIPDVFESLKDAIQDHCSRHFQAGSPNTEGPGSLSATDKADKVIRAVNIIEFMPRSKEYRISLATEIALSEAQQDPQVLEVTRQLLGLIKELPSGKEMIEEVALDPELPIAFARASEALAQEAERKRSLALAFAAGYDNLVPSDPVDHLARKMLDCAACLAPGEPIPRELLIRAVAILEMQGNSLPQESTENSLWEEAGEQRQGGEDALARLQDLGLVVVATDEGTVLFPHLLATFLRQRSTDPADRPQDDPAEAEEHEVAGELTEALIAVEKTVVLAGRELNKQGFPDRMLPLAPHLRHVTKAAMRRNDPLAADLCMVEASYLLGIGAYRAARPLAERALEIRGRILGPEHPFIAYSLNSLGNSLCRQGEYETARSLYDRAVVIQEKVLGPEDIEVAGSLSNLGHLLMEHGDYEEAQPVLERAISIREKVLGPDHLGVAHVQSTLAWCLNAQNDYRAARSLCERALSVMEEKLEPDNPEISPCLSNLAVALRREGDYERARPLLDRGLLHQRESPGARSPLTLLIVWSI